MTTRSLTLLLTILLASGTLADAQAQTAPVDADLLARLKSDNPQTRAAVIPVAVPELMKRVWAEDMSQHHASLQALRSAVWRATSDVFVEDRAPLSRALVKAASDASLTSAARREALELASLVASTESVEALAGLLADPDVGEPARVCLVRISNRASGAPGALRAALSSASPEKQVGLINGLGEARAQFAELAVRSWLNSPNAEVRTASIRALGRIGDSGTADVLWQTAEKATDGERSAAVDSCLRIAESLAPTQARPIFERVYARSRTSTEKCAGLAGIARVRGADAVPLLSQSLRANEPDVRGLAEDILARTPGSGISQKLAAAISPDNASSPQILRVLSRRTDPEAVSAVLQSTSSPSPAIRAAAFSAAAANPKVPRDRSLAILKRALPAAASAAERKAIADALGTIADTSSLAPLQKAWSATGDTGLLSGMAEVASAALKAGDKNAASDAYLIVLENSPDSGAIQSAAAGLREAGSSIDTGARAGCVTSWWVLGPVPADVAAPLDPAAKPDTGRPVTAGGSEVAWKYVRVEHPLGYLDLTEIFGRLENTTCYAYAEITSSADAEVQMRVGSDDGVTLWVNGTKVHEALEPRSWEFDSDSARVRLVKGVNTVLARVYQGGGSWGLSVRMTTVQGRPLPLAQARR